MSETVRHFRAGFVYVRLSSLTGSLVRSSVVIFEVNPIIGKGIG